MDSPKINKNSLSIDELGLVVKNRLENLDFQGLNPVMKFTGDLDRDMKPMFVPEGELKDLKDSDKNLPHSVKYFRCGDRPYVHVDFLFKGRNFRHGVAFVKKYLKEKGLLDVAFVIWELPGKIEKGKVLETYINVMFSVDGKDTFGVDEDEKMYGHWLNK